MDSSNPYAAPRTSTGPADFDSTAGIWQCGNWLVVNKNMVLPARCIKCNQSTDTPGMRRKMSWNSKLAYIGLLLGLIPFLIIALITSRSLMVTFSVCAEHRAIRQQAVLTAWGVILASILLMIVGISMKSGGGMALVGLSVLALLIGCLYGLLKGRYLWAHKIDKTRGWLNGAGPEFLRQLPEFPG